jgi:hypothetical protein
MIGVISVIALLFGFAQSDRICHVNNPALVCPSPVGFAIVLSIGNPPPPTADVELARFEQLANNPNSDFASFALARRDTAFNFFVQHRVITALIYILLFNGNEVSISFYSCSLFIERTFHFRCIETVR